MESSLVVQPVPQERYDEFMSFIYSDFFPREPLALASGLASKTNDGTIASFKQWLHDGLSLMVVDPDSDKIVAGTLSSLFSKQEPLFDDYSCMADEDRCIWQFLDHLKEGYDVFEELGVDQGMELVFVCVAESHVGRGLARRLTEETIQIAKSRGLPFIKSYPASPGKTFILL